MNDHEFVNKADIMNKFVKEISQRGVNLTYDQKILVMSSLAEAVTDNVKDFEQIFGIGLDTEYDERH